MALIAPVLRRRRFNSPTPERPDANLRFLTITAILARGGWTRQQITDDLGDPDEIVPPEIDGGQLLRPGYKLYSRVKVEAAEAKRKG